MDEPKSTSTRSRRIWGAGLLLLALLALVLGVFGAVYFQSSGGPGPQIASTTPSPPAPKPHPETKPNAEAPPAPPAPAPAAAPPPEQQAAVSPEPPPAATAQAAPAAPAPPTILPQDQISSLTPSPDKEAEDLAKISPSAAPANVAAAAPRYWVEFGAYRGSFYAERLKQSLGKLGIAATVTTAPGKHGRRYLRVRTAGDANRAAAEAQFAKAHAALHIRPLLHRVAAVSPGAARLAMPAPSGRHWVQFGAFRARSGAEKIVAELRKNDIQAFVLETKYIGRAPLYLVRVPGLGDRATAEHIAQQGAAALHSHDVLIGTTRAAPGLHPRPPPG